MVSFQVYPMPSLWVQEVTNGAKKRIVELEKENTGGLIQSRSHKGTAGKVCKAQGRFP